MITLSLRKGLTRAFQGVRNVRVFFAKFGVPCFLVTFVLRFALLSYYRRYLVFSKRVLNSEES